MMACKAASRLRTAQRDRELPRSEALFLKFHLMMRAGRAHFRNNTAFLRQACERVIRDIDKTGESMLAWYAVVELRAAAE